MSQRVSQASSSDVADSPCGEYIQPRYYERLLSILGVGDDVFVMLDAYKNFDKQRLISIHNKAAMYLTHLQVGEILRMHANSEQKMEGSHEVTEAADELVPVSLKDLKMGKRNECVVLYGLLCVEPFKFGRIYTLLEEAETGNAVALSIVSADMISFDQSFAKKDYPQGKKIAVKEPTLVKGEGGLVFIHVDNPLYIIEPVQSFPTRAVDQEKFDDWMASGNSAYEAEEWKKCIRNHTKIEICVSKGMYEDASNLRNMYIERWIAHIKLKRYREALEDADMICNYNVDPNYATEVFKIISLFSVGRCKDAFRFLDENKSKILTDAYRIWSASYAWPEPIVFKPDSDFIGPVEVRETINGCGRGLFATEDIETAQVLLISRALAVSRKAMEDPIKNGLLQNVKDALRSRGDNILELFLSHGKCEQIPKMSAFFNEEAAEETNLPTSNKEEKLADKDGQILHILNRIAFDDSSENAIQLENGKESVIFNPVVIRRLYYGVWLLPSFINHSCVPNAARMNVGDIMRIHATKPIQKGEEITIPYFPVLVPYPCRQKFCNAFGFDCTCKRCEVERKIIESESKAKILCDSYSIACNSKKIEDRPTQLEKLVNQTENCLNVKTIGVDKESEAWIRSSFMAAYLARIVCKKRKPGKTLSEKEEGVLKTAAICLGETCPGDIQYLQFCRSFRDLVVQKDSHLAEWANILVPHAVLSVEGRPREDVDIDEVIRMALLTENAEEE